MWASDDIQKSVTVYFKMFTKLEKFHVIVSSVGKNYITAKES